MTSDVELKTPPEWEKVTGIKVYDPDGWDRTNLKEEWARPITLDEFRERASVSTIMSAPGGTIDLFPGGQNA